MLFVIAFVIFHFHGQFFFFYSIRVCYWHLTKRCMISPFNLQVKCFFLCFAPEVIVVLLFLSLHLSIVLLSFRHLYFKVKLFYKFLFYSIRVFHWHLNDKLYDFYIFLFKSSVFPFFAPEPIVELWFELHLICSFNPPMKVYIFVSICIISFSQFFLSFLFSSEIHLYRVHCDIFFFHLICLLIQLSKFFFVSIYFMLFTLIKIIN